MKLLFVTGKNGDRVCIRPNWSHSIFFAGRQPEPHIVIALELPGVRSGSAADIIDWLRQEAAKKASQPGAAPSPRWALAELPEHVWRRATLDDVIDAHNYEQLWGLADYFTLDEIVAFLDRWHPRMMEQIRHALPDRDVHQPRMSGILERLRRGAPIRAGDDRVQALNKAHQLAERVCQVAGALPRVVASVRDRSVERRERELIDAMRAGEFDATRWIETGEQLQTPALQDMLLIDLVRHLESRSGDQAYVQQVLQQIRRSRRLAERSRHCWGFWERLKNVVRLEPNVYGETIDISAAEEVTVHLDWYVLEARRVGRIVPGRTALVQWENLQATFIAGRRRLKFQVLRAGGQLQRMGNTLVATPRGVSGLHRALLEIEMLDALANLNPQQALAQLGQALPDDHPAVVAAHAVPADPRQARVLADMLIEMHTGIDADVARRLVRAQSRAGRRRTW